MNRRTFLKIAGMGSISLAAGCGPPEKSLFSLVHAPDDMVTGKATWYASTCRECPAGCGILAKNREGRVIKVEGNPLHPVNKGKICMRGQAAVQGIYNPDRIKTPLLKDGSGWQPISFTKAVGILKNRAQAASQKGPNRIQMLTEVVGDSLLNLFSEALRNWNTQGPLIYEPLAYEALKTANQKVFGLDGLPSYHMDKADVLVSFGADFLETWLSPVEYAWKFKAMHAVTNNKKGLFFHVGPYQSMTGANSDYWMACDPGIESIVALGLVRQALDIHKGKKLPWSFRKKLLEATSPYTQDRVLESSGLSLANYEKLIIELMGARRPLVLGTGTGAGDLNGLQTNIAANLLNLLLDPDLNLLDFNNRHRMEIAAKGSEVLEFFRALKTAPVELLILNNVNPAFSLPPGSGVEQALGREDLFVVSFSNFMDETSMLADLLLPVRMPLECWDEYGGWQTIASTLQPAMGKLTPAPNLGDVFLDAGFDQDRPAINYKVYLFSQLQSKYPGIDEKQWVKTLQRGGFYDSTAPLSFPKKNQPLETEILSKPAELPGSDLVFIAVPSIRFFDGRGANRSWLCEIPDPLSMVAWQNPLMMHPETLEQSGLVQGDVINVTTKWGRLEAPVYESRWVKPGVIVMALGQGHSAYGRYAEKKGANPVRLLSSDFAPESGGFCSLITPISIEATGRTVQLAHTDGSRTQHNRKIALSIKLADLKNAEPRESHGLGMWEFPFTMPLPEGYDPKFLSSSRPCELSLGDGGGSGSLHRVQCLCCGLLCRKQPGRGG